MKIDTSGVRSAILESSKPRSRSTSIGFTTGMSRRLVPSQHTLKFLRSLECTNPAASRRWCSRAARSLGRGEYRSSRPTCRSWGHIQQSTPCRTLATAAAPLNQESRVDERPTSFNGQLYSTPLTACPGCGALAQVVESGEPGYYSRRRKAVDRFIKAHSIEDGESGGGRQDEIVAEVVRTASPEVLAQLGMNGNQAAVDSAEDQPVEPPLCDRCHHLLHHSSGSPIFHPSIEALHDTISETPFKYNHVYHVLDAADFPLSLVPKIHQLLTLAPQRSRNRRSKHAGFKGGRKTELSFVVTRADLLAPKKEQVDRLMPYLLEVLREALGSSGRDVRLGNVRCVSAKRGWWTKELKTDIWHRGGGGWMVGKVNVGKSNLFQVVFPKGRSEDINFDVVRAKSRSLIPREPSYEEQVDEQALRETKEETLDEQQSILLPPPRQETPFPVMPTVSSLPGTTASPIRIPFGRGRGELIDLPGLFRSELDSFVRDEHKPDLVMTSRITPDQYTIKPGQSLLLGGLIRITPLDRDTVVLAYPFVPLRAHVTATQKAIDMQSGALDTGVPLIFTDAFPRSVASAGTFKLDWDVTKQRAGPLTKRAAAGLKPSQLPFQVLSADILIDGVGWVELVAQVRRPKFSRAPTTIDALARGGGADAPVMAPAVEVFSPLGKFVGVRRPMGAWMLGGQKPKAALQRRTRPRRSMAALKGSRDGRERLSAASAAADV